jgi:D-alanine-D-alanine ligase
MDGQHLRWDHGRGEESPLASHIARPYFLQPQERLANLSIAVISGGESDEREISLQSGANVARALSARGHRVMPLDPAIVDLQELDWSRFDVAFLALHGRFGEDGEVQALLSQSGVCYTGSDARASRLAFLKSLAKEQFRYFGVPTPEARLLHYHDDFTLALRAADLLGFPLIVKPEAQGSSLGVSLVSRPSELEPALRRAFHFDGSVLLEQAIAGQEWTVGLLDDVVLPPIHIETAREFFDFDAKYHDNETRYLFDSPLPAGRAEEVCDVARRAVEALGTRGLVRVDLRLDHARQPWVLEVNTIPGLTDHSLVPKAAAHLGIDFATLCELAVDRALSAARPSSAQLSRHPQAG